MNAVSPTNPFSNQPNSWCMKCGMPLKVHEISFRVKDDAAVDFDNRTFHSVVYHYCSDCKEEMQKWYSEGIRGAVERKKAIEARLRVEDSKR